MSLLIEQPSSGPDVTRRNGRGTLYVKSGGAISADDGSNDPNGSIRIAFNAEDKFTHIELKEDNVYNDTGFLFSEGSIDLGRNLILEATAHFLKTENSQGTDHHASALIPHIPFSDTGSDFAHVPVVDNVITLDKFINPVGEINSTVIGQLHLLVLPQIIQTMTFQVGSVGATSQVTLKIFQGVNNSGELIDRKRISSTFINANTPLVVDFGSNFGFSEENVNIFIELSSANSFSLRTDAGGNVITSFLTQELKQIDMVLDELVLAEDLSFTFTNNLDFITHNRFP